MTTIYHNPNCGTSRKVLGILHDAGAEPRVIEYLKTPATRAELKDLLKQMGTTPRQLLRRRGMPFGELGPDDPAKSDEQLIAPSHSDGAARRRHRQRRPSLPPANKVMELLA